MWILWTLTAIVAIIDTLIGLASLILTWKPAHQLLPKPRASIAIYGVISIFIGAVCCTVSGGKLLWHLCKPSKNSSTFSWYKVKFGISLLIEVVGFVAPFFIFENYQAHVEETIREAPFSYHVFHLLLVNPVTIGLFIYQFLSFFIVHFYIKSAKKRQERRRTRSRAIPVQNGANSARAPAIAWTEKERSRAPRAGAARRQLDVNNGNVMPLLPTVHQSKRLYPDLENIGNSRPDPDTTMTKFENLRMKCLLTNKLYEDPDFPASSSSLRIPNNHFKWRRPYEISDQAQFFCDGVSRFDVNQGSLGDCWFLAAVDNLTLSKTLFDKVVPEDNSCQDNYAGIYHFRFWVSGRWKEVIIDDRLPTLLGELAFMKSTDENEFWGALLEKAYAKLHGSYQNLDGGLAGTALEHLTGGSIVNIKLNEGMSHPTLFIRMRQALIKGSLICAAIYQNNPEKEHVDQDGLVQGHAYSVTDVKNVQLIDKQHVGLLRLRNPWGCGEYKGAWSDRHSHWSKVPKDTRREMQLVFNEDGEFWFPMKDFGRKFDKLTICYMPTH